MRMETIIIKTDNGPVILNKDEFDPNIHQLWSDEPSAPVTDENGDQQPSAPVTAKPLIFVSKKGARFIPVDQSGNQVENDYFQKTGYASEDAAWGAIRAFPG